MLASVALAAATMVLAAVPAFAQTPGAVPRLADGKPDFSGVWWSGGIGVKQNTLDQLADGADKPTPTSTGGWFTTDALHVVERWRLVDRDALEYQATVEDPKILTGVWTTPAIRVKRAPEVKVREAMCLDTTTYSLTEKGHQERPK